MTNIFQSFGAVWPAIGAAIMFGGITYSDVQTLKSEVKTLKENVIYINTALKDVNEKQMELLLRMEGRVSTLEVINQMKVENKMAQTNTVVVEGKGT